MKERINEILHNLVIYDYILFSLTFFVFTLLIVLAIVLREKTAAAMLTVLLALIVFIVAPTLGYTQMHTFLYKTKVEIPTIKQLDFTPALIITGEYSNISKLTFSTCKVHAGIYKVAKDEFLSSFKNAIFPFSPFRKETIVVNKRLKPHESNEYKLMIEPFVYKKDYNVSIEVTCK